ncbi:MAG: RnfABCDGE type electron transport complex subunit G [Actinobacteria bacterium]|nr:RnfABCDGE type electron transport complex subunit G [Actinomycetota bacterium]
MNSIAKKIITYAITLTAVTSIASGSLAYTYSITKDRIEKMKIAEQVNAVKEVCNGETEGSNISKDDGALKIASKYEEEAKAVYRVNRDGKTVAYGILVTSRGYGGPMNIMVGIDAQGKVIGVKVIEQKETPGLGDKVTASNEFLKQFLGKSVDDAVEVKKDIQAVSGATISSKAVTRGVRSALNAFKAIKKGGQDG